MQFLFPQVLWALSLLIIPVVIHLFSFRRFKKVYFSNVRFLKEIKDETANKNKLKNLLVLLARMLAMAALIGAFAQPYISDTKVKIGQTNNVSIFIDNSFSMANRMESAPAMDHAKTIATKIVKAHPKDSKIHILTHDFEGKHQRLVSTEDALTFIEQISATPRVKTVTDIILKQQQILKRASDNKHAYIISDFQQSMGELTSTTIDSMHIDLVAVRPVVENNVSIDSVWFDGPKPTLNLNNKIHFKLKNSSNSKVEDIKVSFVHNGQEKPVGIYNINANDILIDTFVFKEMKSGLQKAELKITDYPVTFDDTYYIVYEVPQKLNVLTLYQNQPSTYLDALFESMAYFNVTKQNTSNIQYQRFEQYDLIILQDLASLSSGLSAELKNYLSQGGKVLMFPSENIDLNAYNSFLSSINSDELAQKISSPQDVMRINKDEFVFRDVFESQNTNLKLPKVQLYYSLKKNMKGYADDLLMFRSGFSFVSKYSYDLGYLYLCTAPLDPTVSDLVYNAEIFVPMIYKMAIASAQNPSLSEVISTQMVNKINVSVQGEEALLKIKNNDIEFVPGQFPLGKGTRLMIGDQIVNAGFYDVILNDTIITTISANYDRKESDLSTWTDADLEKWKNAWPNLKLIGKGDINNINQAVLEANAGYPLWKYCIISVLVFLALEIFFIRYLKF